MSSLQTDLKTPNDENLQNTINVEKLVISHSFANQNNKWRMNLNLMKMMRSLRGLLKSQRLRKIIKRMKNKSSEVSKIKLKLLKNWILVIVKPVRGLC